MKIEKLVGKYFVDAYHLQDRKFEIEWMDAFSLLDFDRLDLIIKYKYIESVEQNWDTRFFLQLYSAHIKAFTVGTYQEPGTPEKNSLDAYLKVFHSLINSLREKGMDASISAILVGHGNVILNGAHRVAISAYFKKKVPIIRLPEINVSYGAAFFAGRSLPREYLDYSIAAYCELLKGKNLHVAILWPRADEETGIRRAETMMVETGGIIVMGTSRRHGSDPQQMIFLVQTARRSTTISRGGCCVCIISAGNR